MAIGVDIESIQRFENKSQKFLDRIYTKNEQKYCISKLNSASHFAVRFCAKEAAIKALNSLGIKHPNFNQIEIYHDKNSCPNIRLLDRDIKTLAIQVSLSHDKTKAIAFVLIDKK